MGNKTVTINLENLSEEQHTQLMKFVIMMLSANLLITWP